jgi:hypothetical protein
MRAENQVATACYVLTLDSPNGKRYENAKQQLERFSVQPNFVQGIRFAKGGNVASVFSFSKSRSHEASNDARRDFRLSGASKDLAAGHR